MTTIRRRQTILVEIRSRGPNAPKKKTTKKIEVVHVYNAKSSYGLQQLENLI